MCVSSGCCLPHLECLDLSEHGLIWIHIEEVVDNELLSLLKPQSSEGEGNLGD